MRYRHNFIINCMIGPGSSMEQNMLNGEKSIMEELTIPEKEMGDYKEIFEKEDLQKKKQYLHAIRQHNQALFAKIKEFDQRVNMEVSALTKKIVPKKKSYTIKYEQTETKLLKQKFQQLQKYKKQLETKRCSIDSLQFLLSVKKNHEIKLNQINKEILSKQKQISQLKKIKEKSAISEQKDKRQLRKLGDFDIFSSQIQQLRMKVREKSENIRSKKQEFLSISKQNRSNKSIILQNSPKQQETKEQDPELLKLKHQYEAIGKRVQILKLKRSTLANQIKTDAESIKKLEKLKAKYQFMTKTSS